ncbi:MAG: hypothetical protein FWD91_03170 [Treponema sp.]|nr:hypothetical protein [Treponema sp.]
MAHTGMALLELLPNVLRARDFHLYLEGGKRITDLWRWGGRAVLGHKPPKVLAEMKNAAERGLFTPLPHPLQRRCIKALREFFPARNFRLYRDESSLRRALADAGLITAAEATAPLHDPAVAPPFAATQGGGEPPKVSLWRPFLAAADGGDGSAADNSTVALVPVLPCPLGPAVLALPPGAETLFLPGVEIPFPPGVEIPFPPGDLIPPMLLAAATRALHNLAAAVKTARATRKSPNYPRVRKALSTARQAGQRTWVRRGIYISTVEPEIAGENYAVLFRRFLEGGFLIPPTPTEPLILPLSMSAGEESKLAQLLGG